MTNRGAHNLVPPGQNAAGQRQASSPPGRGEGGSWAIGPGGRCSSMKPAVRRWELSMLGSSGELISLLLISTNSRQTPHAGQKKNFCRPGDRGVSRSRCWRLPSRGYSIRTHGVALGSMAGRGVTPARTSRMTTALRLVSLLASGSNGTRFRARRVVSGR
jgi:hypothetical protein